MIIKKIILLLGLIYLNGCSISGGTIPSDHFYRLPEINAQSVTGQPQILIIKPVRVDGLYHERAILYVDQSEPLEIKRYSYHYWVETPASLIHKYLNGYFKQSVLTHEQPEQKAAHIVLKPTLLNYERIVSDGQADAFVKLHIDLQSSTLKDESFSRTYEARVRASSMTMHDTIGAFGKALDQITKELVNDLLTRKLI